jgi:hypothetical protein
MDISINVGSRTQPFMMGIIMRGLDMAYQATVMDGTPNPIALTLLSDAAQWIINYAYDPDTGGLYFTRTSPGCEAQSNYGEQLQYIAAIPGTCLSDEGGSIALVPEIIGGMAAAYLRETNATRKQAIKDTTIRYMGHLYGKTGFPCYGAYEAHCDGRYITILEETYTPIATNYEVDKYLGFSYGFGGSFAWQSAEQHTEWPRAPVSRTPSISVRFANFAGTTNVLVELKDQFGQNLTPLTCSASPCQITTADSTAGNHQYRLIYRNASNATLSTGQWQALRQSP